MDKQNLMPQVAQPVNRITTGQLPAELAELSEEALSQRGDAASSSASVLPTYLGDRPHCSSSFEFCALCSYDGDDAE